MNTGVNLTGNPYLYIIGSILIGFFLGFLYGRVNPSKSVYADYNKGLQDGYLLQNANQLKSLMIHGDISKNSLTPEDIDNLANGKQ